MSRNNILVLVEGEKLDVQLMKQLLSTYNIKGRIISYKTNIYALYNALSKDENLDILMHLRSREKDENKKQIFNEHYADKLLIFDLDPQDNSFSSERIREIATFFNNSAENGQLYINYPMIEAVKHVKYVPIDPHYIEYTVSLEELRAGEYKERVAAESVIKSIKTFFSDKGNCNAIIRQNLEKAWFMVGGAAELLPPNQAAILQSQLDKLSATACIAVLCTCIFYILDYNPQLIL
ncbi:MAG: hypothetical protein FWG31_07190 [Oscillospiraceae bacterium]|nr:hypothetical protein [Oscillospiraceae bacterium]